MSQKIFVFFSIAFGVAALYHLVAVFYPTISNDSLWRNILFIFINILGSWGIIKQPNWFIYFFSVWMIQQLYTHGCEVLQIWNNEHRIAWLSTTPLIIMPSAFIFLILERFSGSKKLFKLKIEL
jgi:hypothetical protein